MNQKAAKQRLDLLLVERELAPSREKAKALIMTGAVLVNTEPHLKPGDLVPTEAQITIKKSGATYVSRGGEKLQKAIVSYGLSFAGRTCMDIGASTGGFTDCMLQQGAARVYAIDVGYGQLAWQLRIDPRVVMLERTNIRHLTQEQVPESPTFASIDVSFISLSLVLPVAYEFLAPSAEVVCLVKPQFEAGKGMVSKKGVVHDPAIHRAVCEKIYHCARTIGFAVRGVTYSPIKGPKGNIEYLFYLQKSACLLDEDDSIPQTALALMIEQSHVALDDQ